MVDRPAQEPAEMLLLKRADDEDEGAEINKRAALTSSANGHQHMVMLDRGDGPLTSGSTSYDQTGHTHSWIVTEDGQYVMGEAAGHTHEIQTVSKAGPSTKEREKLAESGAAMEDGSYPISDGSDLKNAISAFGRAKNKAAVAKHIKARARALGLTDQLPEEGVLASLLKNDDSASDAASGGEGDDMPEVKKGADANDPAAQISILQKRLARAEFLGSLSDTRKAAFLAMSEEGREEVLKMEGEARFQAIDSEISKKNDENPVIFKSRDGVAYRRNDDPRLVEQARRLDKMSDDLAKSQAVAEQAALEKRVNEQFSHLPGTTEHRCAMVKAIDAIPDAAAREHALNTLRTQNEELRLAFKRRGTTAGETAGDPESQLEALAKKHAADNKTTFEEGYAAVLKTDTGRKLFESYDLQKRQEALAMGVAP